MSGNPAPNWQPLSRLPMIASLIEGQLGDAKDQLKTLSEARHKPYVLDDAIVARILKVYTEQSEFTWVFEEQLTKWQREEHLTPFQELEIKRLQGQVGQWKQLLKIILELAEVLKHGTIEKILAKDDLELGLEALLRVGL